MSDILTTIAAYTRERVEKEKEKLPMSEVKRQALGLGNQKTYPFERALAREGLSFICEVKKASPSKGVISADFPYLQIAKDYEEGGADCISCLTEPKWFLGSDKIFSEIRQAVSLPMLRKDFTVDEYQIYQSKLLGANAVLFILSLLEEDRLKKYFAIAEGLGMSALFECRNQEQIERAERVGARIIGVNNRNLRDFSVDGGKAGELKKSVSAGKIFVAESGIMSADDVRAQKSAGADAVLVGEFFMRANDRVKLIREMKNV
ncbi:MAG: indole-3-glycerol phosphate synthase TrpC [Clostridia bacterium]|nr:indole-3-glycerol phosphate synthase TrpC [Clostridia bacterium]